jgi:hypothetical protein
MAPTAWLLALLTATSAHAQPAPKPAPPAPSAAAGSTAPPAREDREAARTVFRQLDRNGDGYLSPEELWAPRERDDNWAAVDRNRDGRISEEEFTVLRPPR